MGASRTVSARLSRDLAVALLAPAAAFILAEIIHSALGVTRLSILFLAAVTVAASLSGRRAALIAAATSLISFKFFLDMRTVEETTPAEDAINLLIFLIVALITGSLAGRVRDEAATSRLRAQRMELLFKASRSLSEDDEALWPVLAETLAGAADGPGLSLDSTPRLRASAGCDGRDISSAVAFAEEALKSKMSGVVRDGPWRARTIETDGKPAGVLVWQAPADEAEINRVAELLADLASASLTRAQMRQEQVRLKATQEAAKLREALLSSISHDFRSPLAAIIGSSTSLLEYGDKFDDTTRRDLLLNIQHEGERLNQFVVNLLNMTRLQAGVVQASTEVVDVAHVASSAVERLRRHHGSSPSIRIQGHSDAQADPLLLEQALYNVLENAVKYGDPDKPIDVLCEANETSCHVTVSDRGPGLPAEDRSHVFNSFHFAKKTGATQGTGLGLSISRGFAEAMGGTVEARDRRDGRNGLEVVFTLPKSGSCPD